MQLTYSCYITLHIIFVWVANGPRRCLQWPLLCGLEVTSRSWSSLWIVTSVMAPLGRIQASSPDTVQSNNKSANSGHMVQRNSSEDGIHCIVTRHDNCFQNVSLRELCAEVITALQATVLLTIAGIIIPSRQSPLQLDTHIKLVDNMRKLGEVGRQRQSMVILTFSFSGWAGLGWAEETLEMSLLVPTTNKTMAPYNSFTAPQSSIHRPDFTPLLTPRPVTAHLFI